MYKLERLSDARSKHRVLRQEVTKVHYNNYCSGLSGILSDYSCNNNYNSITGLFMDYDYVYDHYRCGLEITKWPDDYSSKLSTKVKKILHFNRALSRIRKQHTIMQQYDIRRV